MTSSKTRVDEATTDFERELLGSWEPREPSPRLMKQVLGFAASTSALGLTSAAAASAGAAMGAVAPRVAFGLLAVVKWVAVGAVLGTGMAFLAPVVRVRVATPVPAVASPVAPRRAAVSSKSLDDTLPPVTPPPLDPAPSVVPMTEHALAPSPRPSAVPSAVGKALLRAPAMTAADPPLSTPLPALADSATVPAARELGEQVRSMDQARDALASGDPATAERVLDEYDARHPDGILREEAALLRIETLVKEGNRAGARELAARFFAAHPNSPHAARIKRLFEGAPNR